MLPAVFAILWERVRAGRVQGNEVMASSYSFTSERRPGRTWQCQSQCRSPCTCIADIPLLSSRTASCLPVVVSVPALFALSRRENVQFSGKVRDRDPRRHVLAPMTSHELRSSEPQHSAHTTRQNGCFFFCCPRCPPTGFCRGEEARAVCVPEMAAAGAKAAAILGICRM
jgi:hypothetical protein